MASERIYTIPLRRAFSKAPDYRRTERAVNELRNFMQRHMKCDNVKLGRHLNLEMWKHGRKNPPPRIQVKAVKETQKVKDKDVDVVLVELINAEFERKVDTKSSKKEKKAEAKKEDKAEDSKDKLEQEKKEVLEKPAKGKEETKVQKAAEEKSKDFMKHQKMETKEVEKKLREQKMIPKDQKPSHEKKK